jgi:hypothetical protein
VKDGLIIGLLAAAGAGGAFLLLSRRSQDEAGYPAYYGGGGGPVDMGYGNYSFIDPLTGQPIDPITGLPGTPGAPGTPGTPGTPGPGVIRLTPEAEEAIIQDTQDTNEQLLRDSEAANQAIVDAANRQAQDQRNQLLVDVGVGAALLAASHRGIANFARSVATGGQKLLSSAAGLGRTATPLARAAITSPAAPIAGGGAQDIHARTQGQGPYAHIKNDAAAVTAATANTAAATAVGAGSLGLASLDFNRGVHFLGLPIVTTGSRPRKSRLFGQSWLEF